MTDSQFIWRFVVPILGCVIAASVVLALGNRTAPIFISQGGTAFVFAVNMFVFWVRRYRSRSRD